MSTNHSRLYSPVSCITHPSSITIEALSRRFSGESVHLIPTVSYNNLSEESPVFNTAIKTASHGSKDALSILYQLCTPASILFDPRYTNRTRSLIAPPYTFPPSPTAQRLPHSLPSSISIQNLDPEHNTDEMDNKRHPSSFQQLEKLGEGTYATVST